MKPTVHLKLIEDQIKDLTSRRDLLRAQIANSKRVNGAAKYEARKESLTACGEWLWESKYLKVGDIIKVTGSRAGPIRKIISIGYYDVVGEVGKLEKHTSVGGPSYSWRTNHSKVTTHYMSKVTHIWHYDSWMKLSDVMNTMKGREDGTNV